MVRTGSQGRASSRRSLLTPARCNENENDCSPTSRNRRADGFVVVAGEYNHGIQPGLSFYGGLGWRLDADFGNGDWRVRRWPMGGRNTPREMGLFTRAVVAIDGSKFCRPAPAAIASSAATATS